MYFRTLGILSLLLLRTFIVGGVSTETEESDGDSSDLEESSSSKQSTIDFSTRSTLTSQNSSETTYSPEPLTKCPKEVFNGLDFPTTVPGAWATSLELCLTDSDLPILRECLSNGTWGKSENENCSTETPYSIITKSLNEKLKEVKSSNANHKDILIDILSTMKDKDDVRPVDLFLASHILDSISCNNKMQEGVQDNFSEMVVNLMNLKRDRLKQSQVHMNSTDRILHSLDCMILNGNSSFHSQDLLIASGTSENITAFIKKNGNYEVVYWRSLEKDLDDSTELLLAAQVPSEFSRGKPYFLTYFNSDSLFNEMKSSGKVSSPILSILLSDSDENPNRRSNITIWFNQTSKDNRPTCNHWKYGINHRKAVFGRWSFDNIAGRSLRDLTKCEVDHATHFAILVEEIKNSTFLQLITIFGTFLSLIGLCVIILTALVFKQWRQQPTTKVVLNVSGCLLMQIILFILADQIDSGVGCIAIGILLHYFLLAHFFWTLVICYANYKRLVVVFYNNVHNALAKYCLFSWGCPLLIVGITVAISRHVYNKVDHKEDICRPKGLYFQLTVLLPITVIVSVNLLVYILIIKHATKKFTLGDNAVRKSYAAQKSVFLLFFMMGITWIFGLISFFTNSVLILYIFCTLGTFQGFIMFVFYILDSGNVRNMWKKKFNICCKENKYQKSSIVTNSSR